MEMKKGFLFSVFVITALALIVFSFKTKVQFKEEQRADIFTRRVEQTTLFLDDMEKDIERSLYVSTFRAFLGIDEYITKKEDYLSLDGTDEKVDLENKVIGLIINGTLNGEHLNATNSSTFSNWTKRMTTLAERFSINLTFKNIYMSVDQVSPWVVKVDFKSDVIVSDFEGLLGWDYEVSETTYIDISEANFPDPLYYIASIDNYGDEAPLFNSIRKTPFEGLWWNNTPPCPSLDIPCYNMTNLTKHVTGQYYRFNNESPSYLMRLAGQFNCKDGKWEDECKHYGIESFVNVLNATSEIWEYSLDKESTCATDYQFFTGIGCEDSEKNNIINMDNKFIIDDSHVVDYNLIGVNISIT
jgi:hypothetical protein